MNIIDKQQLLNDGRMFHLAAGVMVPLLDAMKEETDTVLIRNFRSGQRDNLTLIAKLEVLHTLKEEILTKAKIYETQINKGEI